jgi:hypothetical protein
VPPSLQVTFGPFLSEYHRALVGETFREALGDFIRERLLSQVDHQVDAMVGGVVACFDEDKYCGPNSAVRNLFRLNLAFRHEDDESRIEIDLECGPQAAGFSPRRGESLYVWTPSRRNRRQAEQTSVRLMVKHILEEGVQIALCPLCSLPLRVVNTAAIFDVSCPARCFKFNFHKDEDGQPLHGHFFMGKPADDVA